MLRPRTDWAEEIPPGEEEELLKFAEILRDLQRKEAKANGGAPGRALHKKSHGGVLAEVRTRADVPAEHRVGIFGTEAKYGAYVRFSNGSGKSQHDKVGDVRGVALKIVGVPGKKLIVGMEDKKTQDFLFIKTPATPFRTAGEFVGVVQVANNPLRLLPFLFRVGFGRGLGMLKKLTQGLKEPVTSMPCQRYWSALPTRYGDHAARYSLIPANPGDSRSRGEGPDALRNDLAARLKEGPLTFTLAAQLYVDREKTPIEDASVDWPEDVSPFVPIADVVLLQQDMTSEKGKKVDAYVETLSFDPWHAPVEFRPIGNMMRARSHAYRLSVIERGAAEEPDTLEG